MSANEPICVDVGGTNTRIAVGDDFEIFANEDHTGLEQVLDKFLVGHGRPGPLFVDAAGPEEFGEDRRVGMADRLLLTNRGWVIDRERLATLGFPSVRLYNDSYAAAHGVLFHVEQGGEGFRPVCGEGFPHEGPIGVIGLGTGIAVSRISGDGEVMASEGGHMPAALPSGVAAAFESSGVLPYHPSYERVISGVGLRNLIQVFPTPAVAKPADIVPAAQSGDPSAERMLEVFHAALGRMCSTLVAGYRATGGVCVMSDFVRQWGDAFDAEAVQAAYLEDVPLALRDAPVAFLDRGQVPMAGLRRLSRLPHA